MCTSVGQSRIKCSITTLFFHNFIEKSACRDWVWYDEYLESIYQKWKILTLAHIFAYNSKSSLPQRASFSHAGTHIFSYIFCFTGCMFYVEIRTILYSEVWQSKNLIMKRDWLAFNIYLTDCQKMNVDLNWVPVAQYHVIFVFNFLFFFSVCSYFTSSCR